MSLLGVGLQAYQDHQNERRNYRNERNLANQQYGNQRMLMGYGRDLQMDMWNKTNYGAQVEHMKNAGLNPALMYGSAGQGGQTGSSSGSASKGNSQMNKGTDPNTMLIGAQIDSMKAKAELDRASAEATKGYKADESGARSGLYNAQARANDAKSVIDEATGKAINKNEQKYVNGLIAQWELNETEASKQKIALGMKQNGIHNDMIATVIGTLSGWDLSEKNAMNKQVGVIPNFINEALEKNGINIEPTMTRRQVMNALIGAYAIGKIALDKIAWIFPKPKGEGGFTINNVIPK